MTGIIYIIAKTVDLILSLLQILMLIRAVISWLPIDEDSRFVEFIYAATEPVIAPVRALLSRFEGIENSPIDISFFITFMLLSVLQIILPTLL